MENEKKASLINISVITGKLMLITCLIAVLLACINTLTEPVIAANDKETKNNAVMELFPEATEILPLSDQIGSAYPEDITEVYAVYKAGMLLGYCADAKAMGFSDYVGMMVGITADNTICGIRILSISDTPGIGQNVAKQDYLDGYTGLGYPVSFTESENHADAISGATYSSRAILNGVNLVLEFCSHIQAETGGTQTETGIEIPEEDTGNE